MCSVFLFSPRTHTVHSESSTGWATQGHSETWATPEASPAFIFPLILTSLPVPASEKHPHSMMLLPPCFPVGMVPGFLQMWHLAFRPKSSSLVSSNQRIFFIMVWESFRCLLATPSGLTCAFHRGLASIWPLYNKGLIGGVLQRWLSFWKVLPSPQKNNGALLEWPLCPWSLPWPRPFSPDCSVWMGR